MWAAHRNRVDRCTESASALGPTVALARGPLRHLCHLPTHLIAIITVIIIIITVITAITATIDIKFFFQLKKLDQLNYRPILILSLFFLFLLFYF